MESNESGRTDKMLLASNSRFRDHGLTIVLACLFMGSIVGQFLTGFRANNGDRTDLGQEALSLAGYFTSGHFVEATFENWESEFLHIAVFVLLTTFLYQRGSAESRDPDKQGQESGSVMYDESSALARRGGVVLRLYAHSLSMVFLLLFLFAFVVHLWGSARARNSDLEALGKPPVSTREFITSAQFWFESFQNWQSEFLAIGAVVVLTIFLRERHSSQSKPVEAPHRQTGS